MGINEKRRKENEIYQMSIDQARENLEKKEPIRRGCSAIGGCFCSGACQEIIGWREAGKTNFFPIQQEDEKSHFEDIEDVAKCTHIEHNPPMHLHIPQGKRYIHVCPGCKQRSVLQPPQISF